MPVTIAQAAPPPPSGHLVVTADKPITLQMVSGHACIPGTSLCVGNDVLPFLSVLGLLLAAWIGGRSAIRAATKTADGALRAAQEQARAAQDAALKQSSAMFDTQQLVLKTAAQRDGETRERAFEARRRRLLAVAKNLAHQFDFLGTMPATSYDKETMAWRIAQFEQCGADDRLIEMLKGAEADALFESIDVCKFAYKMLLDLEAKLAQSTTDAARDNYKERSREVSDIALRQIHELFTALNDPFGIALLKEFIPSEEPLSEPSRAAIAKIAVQDGAEGTAPRAG